ncbi:flavin-containing monooxygenase [Jiangella mangrovi]|uniref:Putative flavoprotein involved in K+ transport n=1 Tax=Jiangella mangrovi TaxID=1524084 RepID=A0A7W9LM47_9ACTN|nr:NAD(P)-binding domain-containing protein [Jiangella mangrovi]MBB5788890.1 putative flavoprotein involved in K+ transport [Jiangella mangrovi]
MSQDIVIIGAGQAGLAAGRALAIAGHEPLLLDAAPAIGHSWRERWDSLRLFTPARFDGLPGLPFPGDPDHHPGKDEVADYLRSYASTFDLPVRLSSPVLRLTRSGDGFALATPDGEIEARQVVVATGPFQRPVVPPHSLTVPSPHTSEYRRPGQLPDGPVVVVGGGNSGVQIAAELAASGRSVTLAVGTRQPALPQRLLGRDLFHWLNRVGVVRIPSDTRIGARIRRREPLIGTSLRALRRDGVRLAGRVVAASGDTVTTADGGTLRVSAVVWATGYRVDHGWIDIEGAVGPDGAPVHTRGAGVVPGLHYLGLPYQYSRGSALLGWVGDDAGRLATRVAAPVNAGDAARRRTAAR